MNLKSPITTLIIFSLFLILLLFVWRARDKALYKRNFGDFDSLSQPQPQPQLPITNDDLERVKLLLEKQKQECKDIDPVLAYYSKEYKNRWTQVVPKINSVGFTPIAKRCAYPGAPCEIQKCVKKNSNYELLSDFTID